MPPVPEQSVTDADVQILDLYQPIIRRSEQSEPGCISFQLLTDIGGGNVVFTLEKWGGLVAIANATNDTCHRAGSRADHQLECISSLISNQCLSGESSTSLLHRRTCCRTLPLEGGGGLIAVAGAQASIAVAVSPERVQKTCRRLIGQGKDRGADLFSPVADNISHLRAGASAV